MKINSKLLFVFVAVAVFMSSCLPIEDVFDETLLIGKWRSTDEKTSQLYYRYDANYKGVSWDESEDVKESEAQAFTWELKMTTLTHIHIMEKGGVGVPKIYTVIKLTATELVYKDDFNKTFKFTKI